MSAISGIDQALWDIKGKLFQAPVYELMGGACRDKMRVYSWVGGDRPSDVGKAAREKLEEGFTAVKMLSLIHICHRAECKIISEYHIVKPD